VAALLPSGVPDTVTKVGIPPPFQTVSTFTRATRSALEVPTTVPTNTTAAVSSCPWRLEAPPGPTGPAQDAETTGALRKLTVRAKITAASNRVMTDERPDAGGVTPGDHRALVECGNTRRGYSGSE